MLGSFCFPSSHILLLPELGQEVQGVAYAEGRPKKGKRKI